MNRNIEQWKSLLEDMCIGTEYDAIINGAEKSNSIGVAIVPKGCNGPQRICIYPKKTVDSGLVVEMDVYEKLKGRGFLVEYDRLHSNRPHYNRVKDEEILMVLQMFLGKEEMLECCGGIKVINPMMRIK